MSTANPLVVVLGGVSLPLQTAIIETTTPIETDTTTLDGTLYTDFMTGATNKRSWEIDLPPILYATYQQLHALYLSQYENETYLTLVCVALGINTVVKANINDFNYVANGQEVDGFVFMLQEQYAVS